MSDKWYAKDVDEVINLFGTSITNGLDEKVCEKRQQQYGLNKLREKKPKTLVMKFVEQLSDFMVIILIIASAISFFLGESTDACIIIAIVILNATLGVFQESKAEKSLQALKKLSSPHAKVIRDGIRILINVENLVPGDIVEMESGDYIPSDIRLIETVNFRVEESSLTGESLPVEKINDVIKKNDLSLGDRKNMAFMGSVCIYGRASGVVVETGMNTQIGKIANMIANCEEVQTPLQEKLEELGKILGVLALFICAVIFIIGILRGHRVFEMFMTSISLAVAAIPEGLPSIVTIVLALGMQKLIKKNAIIRKLPAVETLGAASVICSDKTGTLTQNKMTIKKVFFNNDIKSIDSLDLKNLECAMMLDYGVLCNDTKMQFVNNEFDKIGDPTEIALIDLALSLDKNPINIKKSFKRVFEMPFDSKRKLMSTVHNIDSKQISITKGAPDVLIKKCIKMRLNNKVKPISNEDINFITRANNVMASGALRVLGIAYKEVDKSLNKNNLEDNLIFLGLYGMIDPPRPEAKDAVSICKRAGIKPVMITGDHKNTAIAIARELDILHLDEEAVTGEILERMSDEDLKDNVKKYSVYARVSPEHKVRIVNAWQKNGKIVAMTGDGVNDAPALKKADIGAAMGITGTEVAKGAADMILTDDNFATIVSAVKEGRTIFSNIRKSIHFLLSCNIGEIAIIFITTLAGMPRPLLPIHILWVNLVTDGLTALALGLDPPQDDAMDNPPRNSKSSIFSGGLGFIIGYQGFMIGALTFNAFLLGLLYDTKTGFVNGNPVIAQTMAFMTLSFSQLIHAFNTRSHKFSIFKIGIFKNKYLVGAFIISAVLQISVIITPFTRDLFKISSLNIYQWIQVAILSCMPICIVEFEKSFNLKKHTNKIKKGKEN